MPIAVEATKSGIVSALHFMNGDAVKKGDVICKFEDVDERLAEAQVKILEKTLELTSARVSVEKIQSLRANMLERKASADSVSIFREQDLEAVKQEIESGEARLTDLKFAEVALEAATLQRHTVALQLANFEGSVVGWADKLEAFKKMIDVQWSIIQHNREKLEVKAPADGNIRWYVFQGGFVEVGTAIAVLS